MSGAAGSRHDAGGKSRFPLRPGTFGDAFFVGERSEHRIWLYRTWQQTGQPSDFALWLGMNCSTADALTDDLTVRKDQVFTERAGIFAMYKVNCGTFCSTDPRGLNAPGIEVSHPLNLQMIRYLAQKASLIVVATGHVPQILEPYAREIFAALFADGRKLVCLGRTKDGWPKHSSRLSYSTPMEEFTHAPA